MGLITVYTKELKSLCALYNNSRYFYLFIMLNLSEWLDLLYLEFFVFRLFYLDIILINHLFILFQILKIPTLILHLCLWTLTLEILFVYLFRFILIYPLYLFVRNINIAFHSQNVFCRSSKIPNLVFSKSYLTITSLHIILMYFYLTNS